MVAEMIFLACFAALYIGTVIALRRMPDVELQGCRKIIANLREEVDKLRSREAGNLNAREQADDAERRLAIANGHLSSLKVEAKDANEAAEAARAEAAKLRAQLCKWREFAAVVNERGDEHASWLRGIASGARSLATGGEFKAAPNGLPLTRT